MRRFQLASRISRGAISFSYARAEISPPLERIVIDSCPRAFRHTGVSSPMSAAMTAASAVASATAGRAAGRPRANAKVRLRPVPPRTHLRRAIRVALFAIRREMFGGAARAARRLTARPPPRRVSRRARSRGDPRCARKTASSGRSERPPSACARAIAEPYALGPVRRRLDVHDRPRSPPLRASRDPADPPPPPGNRPRVPSASPSPQPRSASPPRHGASPSRAARGAARRIRRGYFRRFETARPYAKNAASGACFTWRARHVMLRTRT
jgi:hypothetical protein